MKKFIVSLLTAALFIGAMTGGAVGISAEEKEVQKPEFKEVKLTEQQLAELKTLYEDLINQRKGILNKYQEFGVLSEEDTMKMKEHLDMFFEKIEKDGFIPKWDKHKHDGEKHKKE